MLNRRHLLLGALCQWSASSAFAQSFPRSPLRIVVPFAAGGTTDIVGRLVAQSYGEDFGTSVVVENAAGGRGTLGVTIVARARPDGHTLLLGSASSLTLNPALSKSIPFRPSADFAPVGIFANSSGVMVSSPSFPAGSVSELVAMAKIHPGAIAYASAGAGSTPHILMEMFKARAGIDLLHIPYKGTGPALMDMLSGQGGVVMMPNMPVVRPQIVAGQLRALAVNSPQRSPLLPEVPTLAELGYGGMELNEWFGILAPAGTPTDIIEGLHAAILRALQKPSVLRRLEELGLTPEPTTPAELAARIEAELTIYSNVIRELGIQSDG